MQFYSAFNVCYNADYSSISSADLQIYLILLVINTYLEFWFQRGLWLQVGQSFWIDYIPCVGFCEQSENKWFCAFSFSLEHGLGEQEHFKLLDSGFEKKPAEVLLNNPEAVITRTYLKI